MSAMEKKRCKSRVETEIKLTENNREFKSKAGQFNTVFRSQHFTFDRKRYKPDFAVAGNPGDPEPSCSYE